MTVLRSLNSWWRGGITSPPRRCLNTRDYIRSKASAGFLFHPLDPPRPSAAIAKKGDPSAVKFWDGGQYVFPETFRAEIPEGRVYGPGIVLTPENEVLRDVSVEFLPPWNSHSLCCRRSSLSYPERIEGTLAVLSSKAAANYFHWLFDVLPRFALLEGKPVDFYYVEEDLPFQRESLEALGIRENQVIAAGLERHVQARRLWVPSLPSDSGHVAPGACRFLRALFGSPPSDRKGRRLFVSREDASCRRLANEDEFFAFLETRGFERIVLKGKSIRAQADLFGAAEVVVGVHGAGLANLVFGSPSARVIELFSPDYLNFCYGELAVLQEMHYVHAVGDRVGPPESDAVRKGEADLRISRKRMEDLLPQLDP
jgi:hypothetical protein